MCIAILKTKNNTIDDNTLRQCYKNNPDGAGIAYAVYDKLYIEKGFFNSKTLINRVREIEKKYNPTMLIHCRISTSGKIDKLNTHPHRINKHLCLIHNGILDIDIPLKSKKSDTILFIEKYINNLQPADLKNNTVKELISKFIGDDNKFIFLDSKGNYTICNEHKGIWEGGNWYSNTSYKKQRKSKQKKIYNFDDYYSYYDSSDYDLISQIDYNKYVKSINSLSTSKLIEIGKYPIADCATRTIISEEDSFSMYRPQNEIRCLDELNYDLYLLYCTRYDDVIKKLKAV